MRVGSTSEKVVTKGKEGNNKTPEAILMGSDIASTAGRKESALVKDKVSRGQNHPSINCSFHRSRREVNTKSGKGQESWQSRSEGGSGKKSDYFAAGDVGRFRIFEATSFMERKKRGIAQ